ncbi:MAG: sulfatase-like hydrolase/transferase [Verrucomicrobiales bacterium]|nr:sulfatase-like hydrolase/transferase [Verrucomicrobiales bacterium]
MLKPTEAQPRKLRVVGEWIKPEFRGVAEGVFVAWRAGRELFRWKRERSGVSAGMWKTLCLFLIGAASVHAARPNVLMICVDDLKPQLGCYGDATAHTPNIDAFAQRGVVFDAAYCNQAVCSPSRNSLMTGLRPDSIGIYDLPTNFRKAVPEAVTVAQYFMAHGYKTEAMGKIMHKGHGNVEDAASWSVPHFVPKAATYVEASSTANAVKDRRGGTRGTPTEIGHAEDDAYADGQVALEAVRRLEAAAKTPEQPFFIAVGFIRPHLPFVAPQKYWDLYDPAKLPMPQVTEAPEYAPDYAPQYGGELRQYAGVPKEGPMGEERTRHLIHGYYAATSYMDAQLGRVIAALDASGQADNTIVLLWGDHGWHLGDHGMWCKHTNYQQATRIPLLISAPGGARGAHSSAFIETVDLYPTLCDLAGLPAPKGLDGVDQAAVVRDPTQAVRDHVLHVYPRSGRLGRAIRTERYRMVEWKEPGESADTAEYELYDYQEDPLETRNRAGELPDVLASLQAILAKYPEAKPQHEEVTPEQAAKRKAELKKRQDAFKKRDKDGDGHLTLEEFLAHQPDPEEAPKRFPVFDRDGDGRLSEEEYVQGGKKSRTTE